MAWRFKDFTYHKGNVNRFEVWGYSQNCSYEYCKVTAYCQTEAGIRWASQILYNLCLTKLTSPDFKHELTLISKKCKTAGINHGRTEVSAVLNINPEAATAALLNTGLPPEVDNFVIKPGTISVGPCTYRDGNSDVYAKVRFNGFSIPFYFDKEEFLPKLTEKAITDQIGGLNAEAVYKVLIDNKDMLYKRAIERPLNLSNIDEYAQHNCKIMKSDGSGNYFTASQAEIADPNAELITLFTYDYHACFALIGDEVFKVNGVISGYDLAHGNANNLSQGMYNLDYTWGDKHYKGCVRRQDCIALDPADQYVREKIGRSIKSKL